MNGARPRANLQAIETAEVNDLGLAWLAFLE